MDCLDYENELRCLSDEDFIKIPSSVKAYGCKCSDKHENNYISVTPPYLKFPNSDQSNDPQTITIRNKTSQYLELDIKDPVTNVFSAFYQNMGLYGGTATVILVQCTPKDHQLSSDCIRIKIVGRNTDPLIVPLEMFPSISWFVLPKLIIMPITPIGNSIDANILLPQPGEADRYLFFVRSEASDAFTINPTQGFLGSNDGVRSITLNYRPKQYTTMIHIIQIHFPEIAFSPVHEITVYARCIPGLESDAIMKNVIELQNLKSVPFKKNVPEPRFKLPIVSQQPPSEEEIEKPQEDLCTPAGVMWFLLRKGGKTFENTKSIGALGLTVPQEQIIYKRKEKDFHNQLNRREIQQQSVISQHSKTITGDDPVHSQADKLNEIKREMEKHILDYQKALGYRKNDEEDLKRTRLKEINQRTIRDSGYDYNQDAPNLDAETITNQSARSYRWCKRVAQRQFVQAVLILITQKRADKRISKLQVLIREYKDSRNLNSTSKFSQIMTGQFDLDDVEENQDHNLPSLHENEVETYIDRENDKTVNPIAVELELESIADNTASAEDEVDDKSSNEDENQELQE